MKTKKIFYSLVLLTILIGFIGFASAATWTVSSGESIQDAIDAAGEGDTIEVMSGTYDETLSITKDDLIIRGADGESPVIQSTNSGWIVGIRAEDVTFEGFELIGNGANFGIQTQTITKNAILKDNTISNVITAIQTTTGVEVGGNQILNNEISNALVGISLQNDNNIVIGNTLTDIDGEGFGLASFDSTFSDNSIEVNEGGYEVRVSGDTNDDIKYLGSIQDGINAANDGYTVYVNSVSTTTYEGDLVIDKEINLIGPNADINPNTETREQEATITGQITINSDNVIINGFTITNPEGKHAITSTDNSDLTITNNIITDIGSSDSSASGTNYGIAIVSSSSAVDNIDISNNQINNIVGEIKKSADGIAVGWSDGNYDVTNIVIQNNVISDVSSSVIAYSDGGRGAYGILINHGVYATGSTNELEITGNLINNLEGLWAHAIGLEGNTPDAIVTGNLIDSITDHKDPSDAIGIFLEDNPSGDSITINDNSISNTAVPMFAKNSMSTIYVDDDYSEGNSGEYIFGINAFNFINYAVFAAKESATINVAAGLYEEDIQISKYLTLLGPKADTSRNTGSATDWTTSTTESWTNADAQDAGEAVIRSNSISHVIDILDGNDVTIKGFVIEARNREDSTNAHLIYVNAKDSVIDNVIIENNIIGPITGTDQDGTKGRMGIDLDSQSGGNNGLAGSVKGNKIFGSEGNGNNIFVIGSHYNPSMSDYNGMVIEENDVYGSNRAGMELVGGIDGLTVSDNVVMYNGLIWDGDSYIQSTVSSNDLTNIKWGIGINLIRSSTIANTEIENQNYLENMIVNNNIIKNNDKIGIYTGPMQKNLIIQNNILEDNGWDGIRFDESGEYHSSKTYHEAYGYMDGVLVEENTITGAIDSYSAIRVIGKPQNLIINENEIIDNAIGSIQYDGDGQTWEYILNAIDNWWGTTNEIEINNLISGKVDYDPWLKSPFDEPPSIVTIKITDSSGYTNDVTPDLTLTSGNYEPDEMAFSCNNSFWSTWVNWQTSYNSFDVETGEGCTSGDGAKTIYVKVRDTLGNEQTTHSWDSTILDTTAPSIQDPINYALDFGEINNDDEVIINATIIDELSGVDEVLLEINWQNGTSVNNSLTSTDDYFPFTITSDNLHNQETVTWRYYATDTLGNSITSNLQEFLVENRPPEFHGNIDNLTGMEDIFSATINLSEYFNDSDYDVLDYSSNIISLIKGPTSPDEAGIIIDIEDEIATIISTDDWNGNATIEFMAEDLLDESVSSNTIYVIIEADENDPPILGVSIITPINFSEDTSIEFDLTCSPPESDQNCLNFRYDPDYIEYDGNLNVDVDSLTGHVTLTPELNWNDVTYVKFLADDDGTPMQTGDVIVKINVTPVNDNPVLNIPDLEVDEDGSFSSINLKDYTTDVDNVLGDMSYDLVSESNETLIDCELSGIELVCNDPLEHAYGISELIIEVEDGSGGVGNQQFSINVLSVNDEPVISPSVPNYNDEKEDIPFTINLNDYETDVDPYDVDSNLTWSVSGVDESLLSITIEDDLLIVTPLENEYGSDSITLILSDSFGAQDTQSISINIAPINDAPVLDSIGDQNLLIGKQYSYTVTANDVDSSPTFSDDTSMFDINPSTGSIDFTPSIDDAGEHYVNISVSDGEFTDYEIVLFDITFENKVPVANDVSEITDEDTNVLIEFDCTDADIEDVLNYIIVTEPTEGYLTGSVDTRTYHPDENYNGEDSFTYKCSDGLNESNVANVDITINSVNDEPNIISYSPESDLIIREGDQEFNVEVEDVDSVISYVWKVDGLEQTGETTNSYTYTLSGDGEFVISVEASDEENTVIQEWNLRVSSYPIADTFTGDETTDFSTIPDLSSASGVVLENDYGKVEFLDTLDLSDVFDLDSTVNLEEGVIAIDTSVHPQLNKPAKITLTGTSYSSVPEIYYATQFTTDLEEINNLCSFCTLLNYTGFPTTDGTVVFETEHFSSFGVGGSGIGYELDEFDDLEMCENGVQGDLTVEIEEPGNNDDFGPGEEIEIEVKVENNGVEDKKVIVEAYLFNADEDNEEEKAKSDYEEIKDGKSETFDLTIIAPNDFEEDDHYILFVKAYEKGDEEVQCNHDAIEVELEREEHKLILSEIIVDSSNSYPGGYLELEIEVENIGSEDEEDAYIEVRQSSLGISEKSELFDIEEYGDDDNFLEKLRIDIPENALTEEYNFNVEVIYEDGEDSELVPVSIINRTVFEPVGKVIELTKPETITSSDKKSVSREAIGKKSIYEPKDIWIGIFGLLVIGILIELLVIAIIKVVKRYKNKKP